MKRVIVLTIALLVASFALSAAQDKYVPTDATDVTSLYATRMKEIHVAYHDPAPSFYVYVPNRIIIRTAEDVKPPTFDADLRSIVTGDPQIDELNRKFKVEIFEKEFPDAEQWAVKDNAHDLSRYYIVQFGKGFQVDEVLKAYSQVAVVDHAEPVGVHPLYERFPNDSYFMSDQWNFYNTNDHDVDATDAWDYETGDGTVVLGCLDSGVGYDSRDLGGLSPYTDGNIWINWTEYNGTAGFDDDANGYVDDWVGWDFVNGGSPCYTGEDCYTEDNEPTDFNGHGTHVAGIMGAITNNGLGVAGLAGGWNAGSSTPANGVKIMALRIGWSAPHPIYDEVGYVRMDFAAQAIYYAVNNGATAINCSWGSSNTGGIAAACDYATSHGVIIVAAAGNDGGSSPDYLGTRADVVNVCATNQNDIKASFSDYGTWVDIAAPGVDIVSTYSYHYNTNYIAWLDGTSQAAPHVTGAAGLLKSYESGLTRSEIISLLLDYADDIDDLNPSYAGLMGSGRLNLFRSIDGVEAPAVTVIQPNGGEVLYIGQTYTVMWDASDNVGIDSSVIDYSVNSGVDWTPLVTLTGNPGEWDWVVCGPPSDQCRMRVTCYDAVDLAGSDMSDEDFCPPYKVAVKSFAIQMGEPLPTEYALNQNYPNPFNPATDISFSLPMNSYVRLNVFNVLGQHVETLLDKEMAAGEHTVRWNAIRAASGVYFYRLSADNFTATRKMVILK